MGTAVDTKPSVMKRLMLVGMMCAFISMNAYPQDKVDKEVHLSPVVVTGTGTHHRQADSPIPVQVITQQDLLNINVSTLDEALQKLNPSFTQFTNGMGSTLSLNGLSDEYYVFLLNGRRMTGDDTYSKINLSSVKRIEIQSGAASTLYGTNAIGGVVNIITEDAKDRIEASNNIRFSQKGGLNEQANLNIQKGKIGSYTSYGRQQLDSYQLSPYEEKTDKKTGETTLVETSKIAVTGFHSDIISERLTFDPNERLSVYSDVSYYNYHTDRPYDVYAYDIHHQTFSMGAGAKYKISKKAFIRADYNTDAYWSKNDYYKQSGSFEAGDEITRKNTRSHIATLKGIFTLADWNKLSVGVEYHADILKSQSDNIDRESAYTWAAFAQEELKLIKGLQALVGIRYLYHEYFNSYATPNVALMYKWDGLNVRASYAAGFKVPTLSQLYATDIAKTTDRYTMPNVDLKPEKNHYLSLNAEYNHARFGISGNVFLNKIRDMIDYVTIAKGEESMEKYGHEETRQRQNVNKAQVLGFNVAGNAYMGAGFSLNAAYTHLNTKDEETNLPLDKTIKNAYVVGANYRNTWKAYTLNVSVNGRIYSRRYSKTYGYAPHYNMWDVVTRHTIQTRHFVFEPAIGIENIFNWVDDRPYNSNYASLNAGRKPFVSIGVKFRD